jgi:hypothetical protein
VIARRRAEDHALSVTSTRDIELILNTPPGTRARTLAEWRMALDAYAAAVPTSVAHAFSMRYGTADAPDKLYAERVAWCEACGIPVPDLVGDPLE